MSLEFRLPQFGMGMTDGTITRWYKAEGEAVAEGEPLLEVEAAKTTVEVPSPVTGVIGKILVPEDTNVPVQAIIALIEPAAGGTAVVTGDVAAIPEAAAPAASAEIGAGRAASPLARRIAEQHGIDLAQVTGSGARGKVLRTDVEAACAGDAPWGKRFDAGLQIEPRARRAARELGIDLATVVGSGPDGRIVEIDVHAAAVPAAPALAVPLAPPPPDSRYIDELHTRMRRIIAERLTKSKREVPHFYLVAHCEIDRLKAARAEINASFPDAKVSINDFVVFAIAKAVEAHPEANVAWTDEALRRFRDVDVSIAVATDGGLLTPIVREANRKTLRGIARESKNLSARARNGQLMPAEYEGGNVAVSNLGMFGVEEFTAIINPPQAFILAVGNGVEKPVVRDGAIVPATVMTCTLSVDHRAIDGAVAAKLLETFKRLIEEPLALLS
jgi:pyruvate dehydrogenase E2 component (dihydrolipoamide acetyltransferase)